MGGDRLDREPGAEGQPGEADIPNAGAGGGGNREGAGGPSHAERPQGGRQITVELADRTGRVGVDQGTFLQRSGIVLFLVVLGVTSVVILALFVNLFRELAQVPRTPGTGVLSAAFQRGDTLQLSRLAVQYRAISEVATAHRAAAWSHFVLGIKEVVITVFLPLLTGILGYIFGTRSEAAQAASGGGVAEG